MTKCPPNLFFLLLLLVLPVALSAQAPPAGFRLFTSDDGLPSSEVYEILQDRQGYLWFSTDNGVSRYNGYGFENFGALQGLTDPVIFHLLEDPQGRIWMQGMSGRIFYFEKDSIHAFAGNQLAERLKDKIIVAQGIYVDSAGQVYSTLLPEGMFRFSADGKETQLLKDNDGYAVFQVENKVLPVLRGSRAHDDRITKLAGKGNVPKQIPITLFLENDIFQHLLPVENLRSCFDVALLKDQTLLVYIHGHLSAFRQGKLLWQIAHPEQIIGWHENEKGEILTGLAYGKGVRHYRSAADLPAARYETLLEGYSICHILEDRNGGYWFAVTDGGGVFYRPNSSMEIYNQRSGFSASQVMSLALKNEYEAYVGLSDGNLVLVDARSSKLRTLPHHGGEKTWALAYDSLQNVLWAGTMDLSYFQNQTWHRTINPNAPAKRSIKAKHFRLLPAQNELWATYSYGFFKFNI